MTDTPLRAKKSLGQNFLHDAHYLAKIVEAARLEPDDLVVEIGPGLADLTREIARRVKRLVVIEIDDRLITLLRAEFSSAPSVEVVHADALDYDYTALPGRWKVVANLPYYISTAIIQRLIACRGTFSTLTVMLQREVAERITAAPGGKEYGYLSVLVQYRTVARVAFLVPPGAFTPRPKVDSAVVTLQVLDQPAVPVANEQLFVQVIKTAFGQRRKTLRNALASLGMKRDALAAVQQVSGIDLGRRAETLDIAAFAALTEAIREQLQQ
jgi:16S rRNA (adenine1518-N6/adenine1519-N6)-dimethyltransferase